MIVAGNAQTEHKTNLIRPINAKRGTNVNKRHMVLPEKGTPVTYGYPPDVHESIDFEDPDYVPPLYGGLPEVEESVDESESFEDFLKRMADRDIHQTILNTEAKKRKNAERQRRIEEKERDRRYAREQKRLRRLMKQFPDPYLQMISHFDDLNQKQYGIFEYYLQHPAAIANGTQIEIAEATHSTVAALRRFAVTIGFVDYIDMHHAFKVYAKEYETPKVFNTTLDSINPNLLFFENKPNHKAGPSFIDLINEVDHVFLMGRDTTMCCAQHMECLLRHKNVPAEIIDADDLRRIYPTLSKRDLVLYYFNPLMPPPVSTIEVLSAAHVRCIYAFISTSVPRSYLEHIDYYLLVTPFCPVNFLKDAPILYYAANNRIVDQMITRKISRAPLAI